MDTKTLHFIFKGVELVLALIAIGIYCDQHIGLLMDINITVGKELFMYIGLCGYAFVTVILLIVFILDKIPDPILNIVLSAVMALVVLTGGAICIDIYKAELYKYVDIGDYGGRYGPKISIVPKRFQENMMAAGSSGILAAVAFVVDIILTVLMNELM